MVTTAVWAAPCSLGHLGHPLTITAIVPAPLDTIIGVRLTVLCSDTTQTLYHLSLPFSHSTFSGAAVSGRLPFIDWCGRGAGLTGAPGLGERIVLEKGGGRLPLSLWCITSAELLSPANGAAVEPCKESPAGVRFESAWGQWETAGSVWSTSVDVHWQLNYMHSKHRRWAMFIKLYQKHWRGTHTLRLLYEKIIIYS